MNMHSYLAAMVGCYAAMSESDRQALHEWESRHLGFPSGLATSDWPGWRSFIGLKTEPFEGKAKSRAGWLYVIEGEHGLYKIGISRNVTNRLAPLQTASPIALSLIARFQVSDSRKLERALHKCFAENRVRNEWFRLSHDDVQKLITMAMSASTISAEEIDAV